MRWQTERWATEAAGVNPPAARIISFFPLDQTITDTDENQAGKIVKESWSVGGEYSARCDCDNKDYQGVNYFTATTGDLTQKGTYSEAGSNGQQMEFLCSGRG